MCHCNRLVYADFLLNLSCSPLNGKEKMQNNLHSLVFTVIVQRNRGMTNDLVDCFIIIVPPLSVLQMIVGFISFRIEKSSYLYQPIYYRNYNFHY